MCSDSRLLYLPLGLSKGSFPTRAETSLGHYGHPLAAHGLRHSRESSCLAHSWPWSYSWYCVGSTKHRDRSKSWAQKQERGLSTEPGVSPEHRRGRDWVLTTEPGESPRAVRPREAAKSCPLSLLLWDYLAAWPRVALWGPELDAGWRHWTRKWPQARGIQNRALTSLKGELSLCYLLPQRAGTTILRKARPGNPSPGEGSGLSKVAPRPALCSCSTRG